MARLGLCALLVLCVCSLGADSRRGLRVEGGSARVARLALVVGNARYARPLANPVQDARAMAVLLKELGFTVMKRENAGLLDMHSALREFGDLLKHQQGVGLFYYAGHGVQVDGENYLIPVDARIEREDEVKATAVEAELVLRKMGSARNGMNIMILDACRDNPFRGFSRSGQGGLATMTAPVGTFISYATAPGSVAGDGVGRQNGVYTAHLLAEMRVPGLSIEQVFKRVRERVVMETKGKQVPWDASSLLGRDFSFLPLVPGAAAPLAAEPPGVVAPEEAPKAQAVLAPVPLEATTLRAAMAVIPPGTFIMGSPKTEKNRGADEEPHQVTISRGFWLGRTEVTQGQYERVMGTNPAKYKGQDLPVETVGWLEAVTYCNRLSALEGAALCYQLDGTAVDWPAGLRCAGYRLPTEAEWEYAARAGQEMIYAGSERLQDVAWYHANSGNSTHSVGKMRANRWGLYDMTGNVSEWVWDWYGAYADQATRDPVGAPHGERRVARGGIWYQERSQYLRIHARDGGSLVDRYDGLGFRLARSLP